MTQIEFRIDTDRILDLVTLDELLTVTGLAQTFYAIQQAPDGHQALALLATAQEQALTAKEALCKMVWNGKEYMSVEEARPLVGKLTLRKMWEALQAIAESFGDGTDSEGGQEESKSTPIQRANTGVDEA